MSKGNKKGTGTLIASVLSIAIFGVGSLLSYKGDAALRDRDFTSYYSQEETTSNNEASLEASLSDERYLRACPPCRRSS